MGVTLEDFPKTNPTSENSFEMTPGPLGEDPGLSRPVEMHSSRRETPSSALTAANGLPKIRNIFQNGGLSKWPKRMLRLASMEARIPNGLERIWAGLPALRAVDPKMALQWAGGRRVGYLQLEILIRSLVRRILRDSRTSVRSSHGQNQTS